MLRSGSDQIISFLTFLALARILSKVEIGTFAIAYIFTEIGRYLTGSAINQIIARVRSLDTTLINTLFWLNVILAAFYTLLLLAFAPIASQIFDAPPLEPVIQWMALVVLVNALGNTHLALRLREFGHSTLAFRSLIAGALAAAAALASALAGAGVWSLVIQRLTQETVGTCLAWNAYRQWNPKFVFDRGLAKANFPLVLEVAGANLATFLSVRVQDLIIGKAEGPGGVSTYRVAWRPVEVFTSAAVSPFAIVALQIFSRLRDSHEELRSAYSEMLRRSALLAVPVLAGYGILGPWLVPILFGEQWQDAGRIAPALMALSVPITLGALVRVALPSLGHAKQQRQFALIDLGLTAAATILSVHSGLVWVAVAFAVKAYLLVPLQLRLLTQATGITALEAISPFRVPAIATATMCFAITPALYTFEMDNVFVLAAVACGGAGVYAFVVSLLLPAESRRRLCDLAVYWNAKR